MTVINLIKMSSVIKDTFIMLGWGEISLDPNWEILLSFHNFDSGKECGLCAKKVLLIAMDKIIHFGVLCLRCLKLADREIFAI